ncbi:MAG: GAF domain-containing sensor histidine kinase [Anaerolineae bacterium]|jgi:signal transduction histidine kinase
MSPPASPTVAQQATPFLETLARLTSHRDSGQFLSAALGEAIKATNAHAGSLLLVGDATRRVREGDMSTEIEKQITLWEDGLEHRLRSSSWRIEADESLSVSTHVVKGAEQVLVNTPLLRGDTVTGSLTVALGPGDKLSLLQRQALTSFARTIGNLADMIEQLTLTQHSLEQLTFLRETSQALTSTLDLRQVLDNTMELATKILGAQASTLMLIDEETNELVFDIPYGEKRELLRSYRMSMEEGIAGWVATQGRPAMVNEASGDERFSSGADVRTGFLTQSVICVPLQIKNRTIGVLEALNKVSSQGFNDDDLRLLSTLAAQAASAIENARLYRSLREERDKILRVQEEARRSLARDLHDSTLQSLSSISMGLDYVKQLLKHQPATAADELGRVQELVSQALREARVLLFELRPIALETQGLVSALETYVEQLRGEGPPLFQFGNGGFDERLPPDVEATAFIVVQEAVNNARKHANADNIWLTLSPEEGSVLLTVEDDGCGFDKSVVEKNSNRGGHLGLVSMQERAELIEAQLAIESSPGQGTRIALRLPRGTPEVEP